MIAKISGVLLEKHPPQVLVDVHGIGYEIDVPMTSFWQNTAIDWTQGIKQMDLVIKDSSGGAGHAPRPASGGDEGVDRLGHGPLVAAVHDDGGAGGGEGLGDGAPDAPGPSGDDGDPVVEPVPWVVVGRVAGRGHRR